MSCAQAEALEGGLLIALRVGLLSLFENSCVHSVVSPIDTKCSAVARWSLAFSIVMLLDEAAGAEFGDDVEALDRVAEHV